MLHIKIIPKQWNYSMQFNLIIPTYNALSGNWFKVLESIGNQTNIPNRKIIIDSSSSDETVNLAKQFGFECHIIPKTKFNHGLTRQFGVDLDKNAKFVIFMTQDVILYNEFAFANLLKIFEDKAIAVAYGRQLTDKTSSMLEKTARNFNYPEKSVVKSMVNIKELGLHTAFCSDSFAAYRTKDLLNIGGFTKTDFGEDMITCAKLLMNSKKSAYVAEALCLHSHAYSIKNEFQRGRAIGRMHKENPWLLKTFGKAESRGKALLSSVPFYYRPILFLQIIPKYSGYLLEKLF